MTSPHRRAHGWRAVVLVAALLASACSSPSEPSSSAPQDAAPSDLASNLAAAATNGPDRSEGAASVPPDLGATAAPPSDGSSDEGDAPDDAAPGGKKKFPPPPELPGETTVPVDSAVTPVCIERGGTMTLELKTKPESAVGFQALYSDGKGGGPPPLGAGYGGNDKGFASKKGRFTATWVVSPDAPVGRGRVDVVVGHDQAWGYDDPHFAVADEDGNCPSKWISGEGDSN